VWAVDNPKVAAFQKSQVIGSVALPANPMTLVAGFTGAKVALQGVAAGTCNVTATINGQTATLAATVAGADSHVTAVAIGLP